MIFAWNDNDPVTGNGDWMYHGVNQRLQHTTMLIDFKDTFLSEQVNLLPKDTTTRDLKVNNVNILFIKKFPFDSTSHKYILIPLNNSY